MSFAPHLLIRASAGSGKTFQLTTRYLALLARGAAPERVLATTFTRKAAGEIQGRVLQRLAEAVLDEASARALATAMDLPGFDQARAATLLESLIRRLHRLRIATFDSFFGSLARLYAFDLELPEAAIIVPDDVDERLRARALGAMLDELGTDGAVMLLRLLANGRLDQGVHRRLGSLLRGLGDLHAESSRQAWHAWGEKPSDDGWEELDRVAEALRAETLGETLQKSVRKDLASFAARDVRALAASTLLEVLGKDPPHFYRKPLPDPLPALYERLRTQLVRIVRGRLAESTAATWELLQGFAGSYEQAKRQAGAFRFEDVPRALARGTDAFTLDDLALRLDGRLDHLLFDELQDTSITQWRVLAPLVDEIRADATGERTLLFVGDRKQAIYGFRGGVAEIFDALSEGHSPLATRELDRSYRSSPVILETVNSLFQSLEENPAVADHLLAARDFAADFRRHEAAYAELPGYVRLEVAPAPEEPREGPLAALRHGAALAAKLHDELAESGGTVGVLVRTNKGVQRIIHELRRRGIEASEEGGNPLADAPVVAAVLALLTLADHPADSVARFHVGTSPLGALLELPWDAPRDVVGRYSRGLRRALLESGYGDTLARLVERLLPVVTPHEEERLAALVDAAYAYEPFSTLRPRDFVTHIRRKKVEDPRALRVRVMTVHQSKGLEFDAVVLPELNGRLVPVNRSAALVGRASPIAPIERVGRSLPKAELVLVPELAAMAEEAARAELAQSLALLYVAATRAAHAMYFVVPPVALKDGAEKTPAKTFAGLLRYALAKGSAPTPGAVLFEAGDPAWATQLAPPDEEAS